MTAFPRPRSLWPSTAIVASLVAILVFALCLFGIYTRPIGFLAAFWPANAALLALFIRVPFLASRAGWCGAVIGYMAADLLTGSPLPVALLLNGANLAGVLAGWLLSRNFTEDDRRLRRPLSVLYMFLVIIAAVMAATLVGAAAAPLFFNRDLMSGGAFWFVTELVHHIVLLPVLLTAPDRATIRALPQRVLEGRWRSLPNLLPVVALLVSLAWALVIGGPGATAFAIPAILWCALTYSLFTTALLTMLMSATYLIAVASGLLLHLPTDQFDQSNISFRLGVMLMALGPLTVASVSAARRDLLAHLEFLVRHDVLTRSLSRGALMKEAIQALDRRPPPLAQAAVLMMDIDHFKSINDRHGHAMGDTVLSRVGIEVAAMLREEDLFGRLGGEEFALLLPCTSREGALAVAERIRAAVEAMVIEGETHPPIRITISIGVAAVAAHWPASFEVALKRADDALYEAKTSGRNRVVCAREERPPAFTLPAESDAAN